MTPLIVTPWNFLQLTEGVIRDITTEGTDLFKLPWGEKWNYLKGAHEEKPWNSQSLPWKDEPLFPSGIQQLSPSASASPSPPSRLIHCAQVPTGLGFMWPPTSRVHRLMKSSSPLLSLCFQEQTWFFEFFFPSQAIPVIGLRKSYSKGTVIKSVMSRGEWTLNISYGKRISPERKMTWQLPWNTSKSPVFLTRLRPCLYF